MLGCGCLLALVLLVSPVVLIVAAGSWLGAWDLPGGLSFEAATVALAWLWAIVLVLGAVAAAGLFVARRSG